MNTLRAQSRARFPAWSRKQRARWVLAKVYASRVHPHYARMLPLTIEQIPARRDEFAPRTLREAM